MDRVNSNVKISIIVPIYNVENYLEECLNSIINQTFKNFEVICINDGSTDNSPAILNKFASFDKRIIVINQENKGLSEARNAGLSIVQGDYIAFVDSDDYIKNDFLEKLYNKAISTNSDIVVSNIVYYKDGIFDYNNYKTKRISSISNKNTLTENDKEILSTIPVVWNKLYKASLINDYNIKFYKGLKFEDIPFSFVIFSLANNIAIEKETEYYYRKTDTSIMSTAYNTKTLFDVIKIFDNLKIEVQKLINNNIFPEEFIQKLITYQINTFYSWEKSISSEYKEEFINKIRTRLKDLKGIEKLNLKTKIRYNHLMGNILTKSLSIILSR